MLTTVGLVSGAVGALMALGQDELKRLLAYDTVSQMGLLATALGTGTVPGLAGAAYHLANHALFKSLLFLCAAAVLHATGRTRLSEMGGLARRYPVLAGAFTLGVASIVGVPPLNGFSSRLLIHEGLLAGGHHLELALVSLVEVVTFAALAKAAWLAFFRPRPEPYPELRRLTPSMVAALAMLGTLCVAMGTLPGLVRRLALPAAAGLVDGAGYARAVLAGGGTLARLTLEAPLASAEVVGSTVLAVLLGGLLAWRVVARGELGPLRRLRALHTGSVNDYAAWQAAGLVAVVAALGFGWR